MSVSESFCFPFSLSRLLNLPLLTDFAQMQLMDLENAQRHQLAFEKKQKKAKKGKKDKQESLETRHMTSQENLEKLMKNDWEAAMEPVWKVAKAHYKQQEKEIRDHNKKVEEQEKRGCMMDKQAAARTYLWPTYLQ